MRKQVLTTATTEKPRTAQSRLKPAAQPQLQRTPRHTSGMWRIFGDFATLTDGLDFAAYGDTGFNFYSPRGALEHVLSYHELRRRARQTALRLITAGFKRGSRIGIVAETSPDFMVTFFACQYAGLVPCPVPYSMHIGGRQAYVRRITGMLEAAGASGIITTTDLEDHIREAATCAGAEIVLTHAQLQALPETGDLAPFGPDEVAYIQYSSGSTSAPKGVLITQKAATANTRAILQHGLRLTQDDRAFSWLPLYHDMGLVGFCLAPMMGQVTVDYLATPAFARRPALWLKLMSDNRSTIAYAPSFGYDLAARRVNGSAADLDLSGWRAAGIGGDMVRADILKDFASRMQPAGFDERAFVPSYGMAESTLAISFDALGQDIVYDCVDRTSMKLMHKAVPLSDHEQLVHPEKARTFVACGRALPDHQIEVRDSKGNCLGEREIGHILIKGPSLMAGYFRNEAATRSVIGDDGFLDTGDMGYLLDGQIVITGRAKDLILHNGRNIWPQDIEWSAEQLEALRSGDVAAFGIEDEEGNEQVTVLVQCRHGDSGEQESLRRDVARIVHQSAGVECQVVLVPPRSLPFTSSGKLSRAAAKRDYLAGIIAEIAPPAESRMRAAATG